MPPFLDGIDFAWLAELSGRPLVDAAMARFYAFTLVLVRVSGLMLIGPVFGLVQVSEGLELIAEVGIALLLFGGFLFGLFS